MRKIYRCPCGCIFTEDEIAYHYLKATMWSPEEYAEACPNCDCELYIDNCEIEIVVRDTQAGIVIDKFECVEDAETSIRIFEEDDKENGVYEPNFYEVAILEK